MSDFRSNFEDHKFGVPRFAGHSPESGQTAVHFTREGFTWAGSNPVPLWCPEEAGEFPHGGESNPDGGCHHRPVLPLGLPRPSLIYDMQRKTTERRRS
ncbi:PREDICTED: uncharacterized protein LOC106310848 isoform X2 [Brassica oleracea var. oleracea]|uniref:uncharacterized protein LOC106310848 isoform X2 n=1 Tax=Brassica oleracea var. oleracea TaxID=109376 RepID=UPI0006A6EC48|nr:PREDICTED: uncharacterized protein LOC106310848 isoform X2 [Brassica oleracea var. oleracea]